MSGPPLAQLLSLLGRSGLVPVSTVTRSRAALGFGPASRAPSALPVGAYEMSRLKIPSPRNLCFLYSFSLSSEACLVLIGGLRRRLRKMVALSMCYFSVILTCEEIDLRFTNLDS